METAKKLVLTFCEQELSTQLINLKNVANFNNSKDLDKISDVAVKLSKVQLMLDSMDS